MHAPNRRGARIAAVLVLSAFLPLATGCFGSFPLLKKVYSFNKAVNPDKWVQEGVFLLLNIPFVPIYGLASAMDALFLNSVEFWTGEMVVVEDTTRTVTGENGEIASATFHPDGTVDLTLTEADGTTHSLTLVRDADTLAAVDSDGNVIARVGEENGRPTLLE